MTELEDNKKIHVYQALGLTEEKANQLLEVVYEQLSLDATIVSRLQFLNNRSGWTPNETAYALFTFGYGVHALVMTYDAMEAMEKIFG